MLKIIKYFNYIIIDDLQIITFEDRLKTFDVGWCVEFLRPFQMAQAGFIYSGVGDCVKCLSCSKDLENWQLGDDPLAEHLSHSPQCPFIREPISKYQINLNIFVIWYGQQIMLFDNALIK